VPPWNLDFFVLVCSRLVPNLHAHNAHLEEIAYACTHMNTAAKTLIVLTLATLTLASAPLAAQNSPQTVAYQFSHSAEMDPTLSPDGKEMIYIMVIAGKEQLMRRAIDGSSVRQLTTDAVDHEDPAWSPDGKKLAFVHRENEEERIYLMNPDGSGAEPLTPADVKTIHPNWSADGHAIAYCTEDDEKPPKKNPSQVYSIDVATRHVTTLLTGGVNTYPVWSPDGKKFAFRRMLGEANSEVFVANADGSDLRNITNNPAFDGWPAWSPDGTRIAFASNRGNQNYQIYTMNPDGSDVRLVAATEGRGTAPKWSVDGKTIYFTICHKVGFGADCHIYGGRLDAYPR
jgi:TolB protein